MHILTFLVFRGLCPLSETWLTMHSKKAVFLHLCERSACLRWFYVIRLSQNQNQGGKQLVPAQGRMQVVCHVCVSVRVNCTVDKVKGQLKSWTLCSGLGEWVMGQGLA